MKATKMKVRFLKTFTRQRTGGPAYNHVKKEVKILDLDLAKKLIRDGLAEEVKAEPRGSGGSDK